jgi:hypothetical protein
VANINGKLVSSAFTNETQKDGPQLESERHAEPLELNMEPQIQQEDPVMITGWWYTSTYPSEKYYIVGIIIPNIWTNNPNVPNHQPDNVGIGVENCWNLEPQTHGTFPELHSVG